MKKEKEIIASLLNRGGVVINGNNPWDIQVLNENFYRRVLSEETLGLGESYMDGWWEAKELDQFFFKVIRGDLAGKIKNWRLFFYFLKAKFFNLQSKFRAFEIAQKHYDIDNYLFQNMLGKTMAYTCAYWKNAKNLDEAQEAKLDLVCKKLGLKPGMKVLDIGCGFGSFMKFAVEKYQVSVIGISVSKEQIKLGTELCRGLPIEFRLLDYRDMNWQSEFDRVVSIGMAEAVGCKNFKLYLKKINECLKDDGLFLLHTIGNNKSVIAGDSWSNKYIFPNGMLPSIAQIGKEAEGMFVLEDLHNFGADYDKTLVAWYNNFNNNWVRLREKHDEKFYRMWKYYLLSFAGAFRARHTQLWQIVFSKKGILGGYNSIR